MPIENDVGLKIEGQEFIGWSEIDIHRALDTFSSIDFTAPFEPDSPAFRKTFQPFTFKPLTATVEDESLFTGVLVGIDPRGDPKSSIVNVSAYSLPGTLGDCNAPAKALPL